MWIKTNNEYIRISVVRYIYKLGAVTISFKVDISDSHEVVYNSKEDRDLEFERIGTMLMKPDKNVTKDDI